MKKTVEIILLPNMDTYRQEYKRKYVGNKFFYLWDIVVSFDKRDFDHIFYESAPGDKKKKDFSQRRARQMMFMEFLLREDIDREVMYQPERGTIAIFCKELDCVMYLRHRQGSEKLQIGSFFDFGKDHGKRYQSQKKKCTPINAVQLKNILKIKEGC